MDEHAQSMGMDGGSMGFFQKLGALFQGSDEQAMWRVQNHDDGEAFALLMSRWERPIRRLCARMLQDEHKAQDLTQEAFAKIYAKRADYQHGGKFSTFLWRVAVNLCLDELRRLKRRREFSLLPDADGEEANFLEELPGTERSPEENAVAEEQALMVRRAIQHLPENYRIVVILRHYQNLKFREIAEILRVPLGTVKSRMFEALQMLQQNLAPGEAGNTPSKRADRFRAENMIL